jgi:hypothetical protein
MRSSRKFLGHAPLKITVRCRDDPEVCASGHILSQSLVFPFLEQPKNLG